ncbi:MAG: hypothetical protein RQ757_12220 [Pseudomonadales bacterium]|nr:hypothetical protein [Pseudomonadales bacterium]
MKAIEPAELSGYLDRELSEERMLEVQTAIATDSHLCAEFEKLKSAHLGWQTAARYAAFKPEIHLSRPGLWLPAPLTLGVALVLMLVLRFAPKLSDMILPGIILHLLALAIILPWVVKLAKGDAENIREV